MRKGQLFSQDIIFAMLLVLFTFALWLTLRDRVLTVTTTSDDQRQLDEAAFSAMSQLLESSGVPSNWDRLSTINDTTVSSIGIVSDRNNLDPGKTAVFVSMASSGGNNYTIAEKLLGLNKASYMFNFTISYLNGTPIYDVNYTPSGTYNASYAATNTTVSVERFALLNNSVVKVTMGVWIE
jgi:hypothetical protein